MTTEYEIPKFMKAAQASAFGDASEVVTVSSEVPSPTFPPRKNHVIIKVYACSLSPGDYRLLSGDGDLVKKPPSWPYVPGGDICGVVVGVNEYESKYKSGDYVMGTWDTFGIGGIAEYATVHTKYVEKLPSYMNTRKDKFIIGAAVVDSSVNAYLCTEDTQLKSTDKLLVLGASGGVGTSLVQIAKNIIGVQDIVTTSTDLDLVQNRLNVKHCIDYTKENWWESDIVNELKPFDVVIDCAEGVKAWEKVNECNILKAGKQGGRFLAVVVNEWHIEVHSAWDLVSFLGSVFRRTIRSCWYSKTLPYYKMLFPAPRGDSLQRFLKVMDPDKLEIIIDPKGPHEFSSEGVRDAFDIMVRRKGHGKVVIKIRDDDEEAE